MSESKPRCWAVGCDQIGAFACKRCKVARYCSTSCQRECWAEHKKDCSGKVERPYTFDYSFDRTIPERPWLVSDMKKGPIQPMDPPDEYDFHTWWHDRTVEIGGKVVVRSSFFPPKMKAIIRQGLRDRDLTWEYLFSDNFMAMMIYAWVPLQEMLEQMLWIVIPAESKPSLQGIVENVVEHHWRVRAVPGQLYYDHELALHLQRLKVTLPFTYSHCYEDELRVYTHDLSHCMSFGPKCDCFTCQARPFKEARMREAWEVLRRKVAKKGMFMMSWSAKQEYEQKMDNADGTGTADPDTTNKVTVLQWTHGEDEKKTVKSSFTKAELSELSKYIDVIHKQQRLPLEEEMDWIMRKVSVSQERYEQETRREIEKAVAVRLKNNKPAAGATNKTATTTTSITSKNTSTTSTANNKHSTTRSINTNTSTNNSNTSTTPAAQDPLMPQPSLDLPPPVSGEKTDVFNSYSNTITTTTSSTASATSSMEDCTTKMSNVGLSTTSCVSDVLTTTGRPQRRAAAKVISYVDAGASSSDDHRHPHSRKIDSDGAKGGDRAVGGTSDSAESEDWSDTSEDEESSSEGSDSDSDVVTEDSEGEGEEPGSATEITRSIKKSNGKKGTGRADGGSGKVVKAKKPREGGAGRTMVYWNDEMDARLTEAVQLHGTKVWAKVANHVGGGVTGVQCQGRWSNHGKPLQMGLKKGVDWAEDELAALPGLVEQYTIKPYIGKKRKVLTQERIDWTAIGQELGRVPQDCSTKWSSILASKMKKGPFTAEEDALIRQRVAEWGDRGNGLWVLLTKELGRKAGHISSRWEKLSSKK